MRLGLTQFSQECRYYPREMPQSGYPSRRPHLNSPWQNENVMCLCPPCDAKLEAEKVQGRFLSELCDCDIYTRWICHKCKVDEINFTHEHYAKHTISEHQEEFYGFVGWDDEDDETESKPRTKMMGDHHFSILVSTSQVIMISIHSTDQTTKALLPLWRHGA
jgi:hypothetical protein